VQRSEAEQLGELGIPIPADRQHHVHRRIQLDFVVPLPAQPQLEHSIEVNDVGSVDAEERRGGQPRFDFLQRLNVPE